jgi:hypothetical protein
MGIYGRWQLKWAKGCATECLQLAGVRGIFSFKLDMPITKRFNLLPPLPPPDGKLPDCRLGVRTAVRGWID